MYIFFSKSSRSPTWILPCRHRKVQGLKQACLMNSVPATTLNACSLTKAQNKIALIACGASNALPTGIIAKQISDGDIKKLIGFATNGFHGLHSVACSARAFRKDDGDDK